MSRAFLTALKLNPEPAYRIAIRAGVNPTTLSKLITGALPAQPADPRIVAVGRQLGLSPEICFDKIETQLAGAAA